MSGTSIPYHLRINKAVDRELYLSFLLYINGSLDLKTYQYVSLGGPYLQDFKLVYERLGIENMVCIEIDENTHVRQEFNNPLSTTCLECLCCSLEDYLSSKHPTHKPFLKPVILWLDYTGADWVEQINQTITAIKDAQIGSIIRLTLNAHPQELGVKGRDLAKKRYDEFKRRFGGSVPNDADASNMSRTKFGKALLKTTEIMIDAQLKGSGRSFTYALSTHYSDGMPMITLLGIVEDPSQPLNDQCKNWSFYSPPQRPLTIDLPHLSIKEKMHLLSNQQLAYELEDSGRKGLEEDPMNMVKQYKRIVPHFLKTDL